MCGRYTLTDPGQLPLRFDVEVNADTLLPRYNIAPSQLVPVVVAGAVEAARAYGVPILLVGRPPWRRGQWGWTWTAGWLTKRPRL